jgi:hypothetical protein
VHAPNVHARVLDVADDRDADGRFGELRGGAWVGVIHATWPFARLEVYADRLVLHCVGSKTRVVHREDLTQLRVRRIVTRGLVFDTTTPDADGMTFWPVPATRAFRMLTKAGWLLTNPL